MGGGTFAIWNDSEDISGADIVSGELHLDLTGTTAWLNQDGAIDIATYRIVPGDELTLTQPVSITATGTELEAEFSMDVSNLTGADNPELMAELTTSMTITGVLPAGISAGATDGVYDITGLLGTQELTVVVTITLPSTVDGLVAQNGTVNLSSIEFDLVQV